MQIAQQTSCVEGDWLFRQILRREVCVATDSMRPGGGSEAWRTLCQVADALKTVAREVGLNLGRQALLKRLRPFAPTEPSHEHLRPRWR
jgi:hypothetical protein